MLNQQPKNSSTHSSTALTRKAKVNSPPAILNTLSGPGLRKWEYPPIRQRHSQEQKKPSTEFGKMRPQRHQGNKRDCIREGSKKQDLIHSERRIPPCKQFEMPKDDNGMRQYNQRRVPV
jgi:hypothetical protein